MGAFALLALLSGVLLSLLDGSSDDEVAPEFSPPPEEPTAPPEPDEPLDTGATFSLTKDGVELELGADETGSLAVVYYQDTEDADVFIQEDEARFYLVPEDVDWSDASWETQQEIPGADTFDNNSRPYELADFERQHGLELLGVIDLLDVPASPENPAGRVGTISANAPIAGYILEANTDGDDLVTFLPEDFVVVREGLIETTVNENTTGSNGSDWLTASVGGIAIDGAGGADILGTSQTDVTLNGGLGDDTFEAYGTDALIIGGPGDDQVTSYSATVQGGPGEDNILIHSGVAEGGDGKDTMSGGYGPQPALFYGQAGDDHMYFQGEGSAGFGGDGDDFVAANGGAIAHGGNGDDRLQLQAGTTGFGDAGDDLFTIWEFHDAEEGPVTATGSAGADTYDVLVRGAYNGAAEQDFLRITDFNPNEDVLQVGAWEGTTNPISEIEIIEAEDGSYTDVRLHFFDERSGLAPGSTVVRLEGTTGLTEDQIVIDDPS